MLFSLIMGVAIIFFYIRFHKRLSAQQNKIMASELRHQKELLQAAVLSQEGERRRIGQDLHDDVGNILLNLRILFNRKQKNLYHENVEVSTTINTFIDNAIEQVRNISHRLSPATLEYFGFRDAMEEMLHKAHLTSGIRFRLKNMESEALKNITYDISLHIYRVFEELLTNTLKHANATEIEIEFFQNENSIQFTYHDNGKGFDLKSTKGGIGLHNINSRVSIAGGTSQIITSTGNGVKFFVSIPLTFAYNK